MNHTENTLMNFDSGNSDKRDNSDVNNRVCDNMDENKTDGGKRSRTKPKQFALIADFYEKHNEEFLSKDTFDKLWDELSIQLNLLGPPTHSWQEWKRIWSEHKYNKKRKRSDVQVPEGQSKLLYQPLQTYIALDNQYSCTDNNIILGGHSVIGGHPYAATITDNQASTSTIPPNIDVSYAFDQPQEGTTDTHFRSEMLQSIAVVTAKQDKMIDLMTESNGILKDILNTLKS